MKNENRIDTYFGRVKKNPPLIEIEMVHQILNEAEVKAKVEPKKGHPNLLKFSIMTTLFAIVISVFLFWPKAPEEISNSKEQISTEISIVPSNSTSYQQSANDVGGSVKDTILPTSLAENVSTSNSASARDLTARKLIPFKVSNIAFVHSSKNNWLELVFLESKSFKIGEKDSSISLAINSGDPKKPVRGEYHFSEKDADQLEYMSFTGQYSISNDSVLRITGGKLLVDTIGRSHSFQYELLLENDYSLAGQFVPDMDFNRNEKVKKDKPEVKEKYPEQILDSTLFIDLNRIQLENLGFKLSNDAINLFFLSNTFTSYRDSCLTFGVNFDDRPSPKSDEDTNKFHFEAKQAFIITKDTVKANDTNGELIPMLITNSEGENLLKMAFPEMKLKTLFSQRFSKDFKTLLPVVLKKDVFGHNMPKEDIVYWFLPTDDFFNLLPQNVSEELLTEYDYIWAENKSVLEKPECKYFEECKNTLDVFDFKVFPNPANSTATISFTLNEQVDGRITLVDLAGRERQVLQSQTSFTKGSHRMDVDVSTVPEGIYLITLFSDKGIQTQRFIVTR
ncbi:MAG: T9SS type A sorting domain-containing protein [Prolixibacteraceae bacterium]